MCRVSHYMHPNSRCPVSFLCVFNVFSRMVLASRRVQPPIAELVARYFALLVSGERQLPEATEMQAEIVADRDRELALFAHDAPR